MVEVVVEGLVVVERGGRCGGCCSGGIACGVVVVVIEVEWLWL